MLINSDLLLSFSTFRNIVDKIKIEKFYIDKINLNETHWSLLNLSETSGKFINTQYWEPMSKTRKHVCLDLYAIGKTLIFCHFLQTTLSVRCQSHVQFWTKSIFPTWSSYNITFSSYEYTASFWIQYFFNYREKYWSVLAHKYGRRCLYFLICEAERGLRQTWFSTLHT